MKKRRILAVLMIVALAVASFPVVERRRKGRAKERDKAGSARGRRARRSRRRAGSESGDICYFWS